MLNSLLRNAATPLSLHRISRLSLAVSLILSAPYGQVLAANIIQSEINGVFSGSSDPTGDNVISKENLYGDVSGGKITVNSNSTVTGGADKVINIAGGYSPSGSVTNSTAIHNGSVNGLKNIGFYGGFSENGSVSNNNVIINGSISNVIGYARIYGGFINGSTGSADFNTVTISNASFSNINQLRISGGAVNSDGSASNNTVIIKNISLVGITSPSSGVYGGLVGGTGTANNNTVIIEGGESSLPVTAGYANSGSANGNTIIVNGTKLVGLGNYLCGGDGDVSAINNKIYVYGTTDLSSARLFGNTGGNIAGNTLILGPVDKGTFWSPNNTTIGMVSNFEKIAVKGTKWGQTITINTLDNSLSTSGQTTAIDVGNVSFIIDDASILEQGASYDVLKVNTFNVADIALASTSSTFTAGTTLQGTGTVSLRNADTVTYTINKDDVSAQPQTHDVVMVSSAATTAINQIADTSEMALMNLLTSGNAGLQLFGAVGGGAARAENGSHITLKSLNMSLGVGNHHITDYGLLSWGAAFEYGHGIFHNSYNAGSADPYVSKNGYLNFYGGALLGKIVFNNLYHVNGTLRAGTVMSRQKNALYDAARDQNHDVKLDQPYQGAELGFGKIFKLDDTNSIDLYSKYFFLHQNSDSFNAGGYYKVHNVFSHRLKLAGRYQLDYAERKAFYAGLGGEYEFDGKSELTVETDVKAKPAKLDGYRTCVEIGFLVKPDENLRGLSLDLTLKGRYGAEYRDIYSNAELKYYF